MIVPAFDSNRHYIELRGGSSRFELNGDVALTVPYLERIKHRGHISFRDAKKHEWANIADATLVVRGPYRWNGASPKWWLPLVGWVGTPDPPATRLATLVHDVCFQFLRTADWPIPYEECNALFHQIMVAHNFKRANTYHGAVKDFGKLFCGDYPAKGEHSIILKTDDEHQPESAAPCLPRPCDPACADALGA